MAQRVPPQGQQGGRDRRGAAVLRRPFRRPRPTPGDLVLTLPSRGQAAHTAGGFGGKSVAQNDTVFAGSIPQFYDQKLGALLFAPYAADMAMRVRSLSSGRLLETAAGTGIVTRQLATHLPPDVEIVATDLNQPMLDYAAAQPGLQRVKWQQADALALPFPDASFDAVVCQFGVMFFPDRTKAYREARRVLRPGGHLVFNVWDRIEASPV